MEYRNLSLAQDEVSYNKLLIATGMTSISIFFKKNNLEDTLI